MRSKLFLYLLAAFIGIAPMWGQYESGITYPDIDQDLTKDFNDLAYRLSTTINAGDLLDHLSVLASDEFEGRETGHPGIEKAADYIAGVFEDMKLPRIGDDGTYYQKVAFTFTSWKNIQVIAGDKTFRQLRDFIAFPHLSEDLEDNQFGEIVFGGYGIADENYSDVTNVLRPGQILMVYDGEPVGPNGNSHVSKEESLSDWSTDWQKKSRYAKQNGAKLLMIVSKDVKKIINENRRQLVNTVTQLGDKTNQVYEGANTLFISTTMAEALLGGHREAIIAERNAVVSTGRPFQSFVIPIKMKVNQTLNKKVVTGKNMLGFVEGNEKKDELVIISAHYDHVGTKGQSIFNGADDNASGTSTVLEILETLVTAKKMGLGPKRSVLCVLMTGEEKGLLGSEYYAENPIFPIEKTIANVNIDMVGRRDDQYSQGRVPYIYVIGSDRLSKDLHHINEKANKQYAGMILDYKYNDAKDPNRFYYRSDHYNFARKGIPAIFFFSGVHEDYHRSTDTIEKIDFELMSKRARLIFQTTWELANRKERIRLTSNPSAD